MTTLEHVIHISRIDAAIEVVNIQTGVCVSLTSTDKCIYAFMRNRVKFFGNSGKDYYDNIEFIAALQGLSEKTVRNTKRNASMLSLCDRGGLLLSALC